MLPLGRAATPPESSTLISGEYLTISPLDKVNGELLDKALASTLLDLSNVNAYSEPSEPRAGDICVKIPLILSLICLFKALISRSDSLL